jgi:hypothetical protein
MLNKAESRLALEVFQIRGISGRVIVYADNLIPLRE